MERIRIAHILTKLDLGGSQQSAMYTAANLNRALFDVALIAGPNGMLDDEAKHLPNVTVRFCGELSREIRPLADHQAYMEMRQILREWKPDIVHTHHPKAGIIGRLAASAENVPTLIHTFHGFAFHRYQTEGVFRLSLALEREASRRTNHLIFISEENRRWAEELDLIGNRSATLIRSGVEVEPLLTGRRNEQLREELGVPKKGKAVGMIAALRTQKDPLTFIEAADRVARKKRNVKFLLFGDGEMAGAVLERASKMPSGSFLHLGWRRDIPHILPNLDILVVTSLWESLPHVIPEATIAGVPVIASDIDGNREIIHEGRNGVLAEPRNAEDFADKILAALDEEWAVDPDVSRQIQHEFDIRAMIRQQEELYLASTFPTSPGEHDPRIAAETGGITQSKKP